MRKLEITGEERILIIRTDRIGDLVLSTPLLEAIKSRFPKVHVTMMVSPYAAGVLENNPFLDEVMIDDVEDKHKGIKGFFLLAKEVRQGEFEVGILLRPTLRLALMLFWAGVKYRIGTGFRFYQIFFNRKVYVHRKVNLKHEVEYNMDLLAPLGIIPPKILPKVYVTSAEEEFVRKAFTESNITPEDIVVVIHPGSGKSSLNLPAKRFAEAADELIEKIGAKVVFTGSDTERNLIDFIKNHMRHECIDLSGKTTIPQLKAVLKKCDVFISNSTGPMHLACALGTPTLAIFCPIFAAGPVRWGPYGEGHQVIIPPVPVCFKCKPSKCPHYDCMDKIKTEQIVSKASLLLKTKIDLKQSHRQISRA
jgi:lipopolysaccharide heptosyltransferase II